MLSPLTCAWCDDQIPQSLVVSPGELPTPGVPFIDEWYLGAKNGRLKLVQPAVDADNVVMIALGLPVSTQHLQFFIVIAAMTRNGTAVSESAEILARVETEGPDRTSVPAVIPAKIGTSGLGDVFDDRHTVGSSGCENRLHVGDHAVQVNGHNRLCLSREFACQIVHIDHVCIGIDVDENRCRSSHRNGRDSGYGPYARQ